VAEGLPIEVHWPYSETITFFTHTHGYENGK
jgi:hypothetical protein